MSCAPRRSVSIKNVQSKSRAAYKNHTAHHVHAGAEAAEEDDLVGGDHPFATGLDIDHS